MALRYRLIENAAQWAALSLLDRVRGNLSQRRVAHRDAD